MFNWLTATRKYRLIEKTTYEKGYEEKKWAIQQKHEFMWFDYWKVYKPKFIRKEISKLYKISFLKDENKVNNKYEYDYFIYQHSGWYSSYKVALEVYSHPPIYRCYNRTINVAFMYNTFCTEIEKVAHFADEIQIREFYTIEQITNIIEKQVQEKEKRKSNKETTEVLFTKIVY